MLALRAAWLMPDSIPEKSSPLIHLMPFPMANSNGVNCASGTAALATVCNHIPISPVALKIDIFKSSKRACMRACFSA